MRSKDQALLEEAYFLVQDSVIINELFDTAKKSLKWKFDLLFQQLDDVVNCLLFFIHDGMDLNQQ